MFGLRIYSCSLFEQFCPPKFPFLLWLKLLVCCTIESDCPADRWMKIIFTRPCLRLRTNLGPRIAFWVLILGHILVPVSGSIFGHRFGALDFVCNCRDPKRCPKMEPETGTKIWPKSGPKMQSGAPNLYEQGRVEMIFIQQSAGQSDSIVQQTNNFNQRRKGNLGGQNCSNREHEYIRRPNIVKTCFTCRRYTVKSHAWENQQHACYSSYGKSPSLIGKSTISKPFSIAMLNFQRVNLRQYWLYPPR